MKLKDPPLGPYDLILKGFFHDRIIPPLATVGLKDAVGDLVGLARKIMTLATARKYRPAHNIRSRCVQHSVPKRKHLRRMLAIPNPLHQAVLSCEIADCWPLLLERCQESEISLSKPKLSSKRGIEPEFDRRAVTIKRAQRSVGMRYVLKTDLSRFYPSIYTHSIPWAIHGKDVARADRENKLPGNRIDLWTRETQDKQTGGIPIGPDTSYLLAEVIASRLDVELQRRLPCIRGTRHIDDFNLYFVNLSDAEKALAVLHGAARQFELEINDIKTEILPVPEALEPFWKTQLRSLDIRDGDRGSSLKSLFDRAVELSEQFKHDSVHTYAVRKVLGRDVGRSDWEMCEPLLLRSALGEPSLLPWLLQIYEKSRHGYSEGLVNLIDSLCRYHSPLQQGNEVAWSLWIARTLKLELSKEAAEAVVLVDDDIVALVALDLMDVGLMPTVETPLWESHINADSLYSDHWLLAYEAYEQEWLQPSSAGDYIAEDAHGCFPLLREYGVKFYDPERRWEGSYSTYSDDDDNAQEDETTSNEHESEHQALLAIPELAVPTPTASKHVVSHEDDDFQI
ncbi:MAG TPA: RNA-directed DNA polymerase [Candidatus Acidoferrum sp.]